MLKVANSISGIQTLEALLVVVVFLVAGCGAKSDNKGEGKTRFDVTLRRDGGVWVASTKACGGQEARARIQADALRLLSTKTITCLNERG